MGMDQTGKVIPLAAERVFKSIVLSVNLEVIGLLTRLANPGQAGQSISEKVAAWCHVDLCARTERQKAGSHKLGIYVIICPRA